jgi:hypothetical protein
MDIAEPTPQRLTWSEICERYRDAWVRLRQVERVGGVIDTAIVDCHGDLDLVTARSRTEPDRDAYVAHTAGQSLIRRLRIWTSLDEDRDTVRARPEAPGCRGNNLRTDGQS